MEETRPRQHLALPTVIFFYQFMTVVVNVTLTFYVQAIVPGTRGLQWTGWMLGIVPLLAILTTPIWMRWSSGPNPRRFYVIAQALHGGSYLATGVARSLWEIFAMRVLLGTSGPPQSIVLVIIGRTGGPDVRWAVSALQTATTLGTALAPIGAAMIASLFGFTFAFVAAGLIMWVCGAVLLVRVAASLPPPVARPKAAVSGRWLEVGLACGLTLVGYTHVYFLTAILPKVVAALGVDPSRGLTVGGWILLGSGVSLALGSMAVMPLTDTIGERETLVVCLLAASLCLASLGLTTNPITFVAIRMLETLCIAPIMVLATARITQTQNSQAIGLVNSSRVLAAFVGPVVSTSILAWSSLPTLFVALAMTGGLCVFLVPRRR